MIRRILLDILMIALLTACQPVKVEPTISATAAHESVTKAVMIEPEGFIQQIHDPVIARQDGTYYIFSTGSRIPFICSKDKVVWEFCGRVFASNPAWTGANIGNAIGKRSLRIDLVTFEGDKPVTNGPTYEPQPLP